MHLYVSDTASNHTVRPRHQPLFSPPIFTSHSTLESKHATITSRPARTANCHHNEMLVRRQQQQQQQQLVLCRQPRITNDMMRP